jgi:hypothetical protein
VTSWNSRLRDPFEWLSGRQLRPAGQGYPMRSTSGSRSRAPGASAPAERPRPDGGAGDFTIDWVFPEPTPVPFTTIAWRLGTRDRGGYTRCATRPTSTGRRSVVHCFRSLVSTAEALAQLDHELGWWLEGVRGLGEPGLCRPCVRPRAGSPTRRSPLWCSTFTAS